MDTLLVKDPRINVVSHTAKEHLVVQGASRITEYVQPSNSYSSRQANWSFQPPSTKTIVDRNFRVRSYIRVTTEGADLDLGTRDALRQFPLASIMTTLEVKLNGGSLSESVGRKIHAMLCYNNGVHERSCWSTSPAMPDAYQKPGDWRLYGSGKSPLTKYGENSSEDTRGGFPVNLVSPTVAEFVVTEPLFMAPFDTGCGSGVEGFVNVNQIDITMSWDNNLRKVFTHDNTAPDTLTNITVEFYQQPELLVRYMTPDQNQPLPALQVLPYLKYNDFPKERTIGAGVTTNVNTDTFKFNQIPKKIMIFARRSNATTDYTTSDSFGIIKKISLLWNNESSLLQSATQQDLWQISRRNGCNLSWSAWSKYRGSVFMGEFGVDIGLIQGLSAGVMGQFTLQANVEVENPTDESIDYEIFVSILLAGSVELSENALATNLGNLTVAAVEDAELGDEITHADAAAASGGGFFTDISHFFNKLSRGVQDVSKVAAAAAPVVGMVNPGAGAVLGLGSAVGQSSGALGRALTGGRLAGGSMAGGRLAGGSMAGGRLAGGRLQRRRR